MEEQYPNEYTFFLQFLEIIKKTDISFILTKILLLLETEKDNNKELNIQEKYRIIVRLYNLSIDMEDYPDNYI